MKYFGNPFLNHILIGRKTITPPVGFYSNGTIFKGTMAAPVVATDYAGLDDTVLGVLHTDFRKICRQGNGL